MKERAACQRLLLARSMLYAISYFFSRYVCHAMIVFIMPMPLMMLILPPAADAASSFFFHTPAYADFITLLLRF